MNQDVINKILEAKTPEQAQRVLREHRSKILTGIGDRTIEPTDDVMRELFDINLVLGDADDFTQVSNA